MPKLRIEPNIATPDDLYESLLDAHRGLTLAQSHALNARLVLLLANHVGDVDVVREALGRARASLSDDPGVDPRADPTTHGSAGASPSIPRSNEGVDR
jgi:uncharacterized protein DUF2783